MLYEIRILLYPVTQIVQERCLESAETVVVSGDIGLAERICLGISLTCQAVYYRTSGITETHNLGALVHGLAGGIIDGLSKNLHFVV